MSETAEATAQISTEQTQEKVIPSPFAKEGWSEELPKANTENTNTGEASGTGNTAATTTEATTEKVESFDEKGWLKKEFDIEDISVLKAEREELKLLKAKVPEEIKFENEESKQLHELIRTGKKKEALEIINQQEQIEQYASVEVGKDNAEDIIKLSIKLKNPKLTKEEIQFEYQEQYTPSKEPKEPIQRTIETDEEFSERTDEWKDKHAEWSEKVTRLETKRVIAAKMAQPELEAAKVKLVLPQIDKPTAQANEPTAEQIEQDEKWAENFVNTVNSNYSKVEGFETKVKDELVEYPVSFKIPDEDKVAMKERLIEGVDPQKLMLKRWFNEKKEANVEQMQKDLYVLENLDKILSGVANKAASERLVQYRKSANNIDLKGDTHQETFNPQQNGNSKVSPYATEAWSEKPPTSINN